MRAISLWEPWGTAIAKGLKKIETRGWSTNYRGPLAIHCAKTREHVGFIHHPDVREYFQGVDVFLPCKLPFGCVVATCELVEVVPTEVLMHCQLVSPIEFALGGYDAGRFGWRLENVQALATPVPWKGSQGFFDVPDHLLTQP